MRRAAILVAVALLADGTAAFEATSKNWEEPIFFNAHGDWCEGCEAYTKNMTCEKFRYNGRDEQNTARAMYVNYTQERVDLSVPISSADFSNYHI
jgi:hypothetical protein